MRDSTILNACKKKLSWFQFSMLQLACKDLSRVTVVTLLDFFCFSRRGIRLIGWYYCHHTVIT